MKFRRRAGLVIAALLVAAAALPAPRSRAGAPPNVLLVTIDTLRADHLHCYGQPLPTSPNIDAFAARSVLFERAIAASGYTGPAHSAIMTSKYPRRNSMGFSNGLLALDGVETLAEVFRRGGYDTAAFVSNGVLGTRSGLNRGFDVYDDEFPSLESSRGVFERLATQTVERALTWLGTARTKPFFLWVHFQDPHGPYMPPPPYRERFHLPRRRRTRVGGGRGQRRAGRDPALSAGRRTAPGERLPQPLRRRDRVHGSVGRRAARGGRAAPPDRRRVDRRPRRELRRERLLLRARTQRRAGSQSRPLDHQRAGPARRAARRPGRPRRSHADAAGAGRAAGAGERSRALPSARSYATAPRSRRGRCSATSATKSAPTGPDGFLLAATPERKTWPLEEFYQSGRADRERAIARPDATDGHARVRLGRRVDVVGPHPDPQLAARLASYLVGSAAAGEPVQLSPSDRERLRALGYGAP